MKRLVLVDGHNILFRSFAVPFSFHSSHGTPLHVVTTFLKFLRRSIAILPTDGDIYLAVVFDTQTETSNHALTKEYKANRTKDFSKQPNNPFIHLPLIQKALREIHIPYFEVPYVEADDVIATIARSFSEIYPDSTIYIVSNDTDFYQLLNDHIVIVKHMSKGASTIISAEDVQAMLGIPVSSYVYFKSLIGDKADNISGIPRVGSKRAQMIINGELDIDISRYSDILEKNITLISLTSTISLDIDVESLRYEESLSRSNESIFSSCGF